MAEPNVRGVLAEIALCKVSMSLATKTITRYLAPAPGADLPARETILAAVGDLEAAAAALKEVCESACHAIQPPLKFPKATKSDA